MGSYPTALTTISAAFAYAFKYTTLKNASGYHMRSPHQDSSHKVNDCLTLATNTSSHILFLPASCLWLWCRGLESWHLCGAMRRSAAGAPCTRRCRSHAHASTAQTIWHNVTCALCNSQAQLFIQCCNCVASRNTSGRDVCLQFYAQTRCNSLRFIEDVIYKGSIDWECLFLKAYTVWQLFRTSFLV